MKTSRCSALALLCVLAWSARSPGVEPTPPVPVTTPASLNVPANQQPILVLTAKGVQIYECRAVAGTPDKFEWAFKAPEAELFDAQGRKAGRHYAGPTWESADGSKAIGKVKAKADAPDGKGIPWLLLDVNVHYGEGVMAKVESIQRVATVGGKAPTEAVDQSKTCQERRVEYTATYVFYAVKP